MPNPKLETYKNKATGTVYDFTDADAQSKVTATVDLLKDTTGWLGGNRAKITRTGTTSDNGVSYTVNANKSVTANGATTGSSSKLSLNVGDDAKYDLVAGEKIVLSGGVSDKIRLNLFLVSNPNTEVLAGSTPVEWTVPTTGQYTLQIYINTNTTVDNVTLYPMILTPEQYALNPSYRPNHGSVEEVKADKSGVISALDDTVGWVGIQQLRHPYEGVADGVEYTNEGITYITNALDYSVLVKSGTSTGYSERVLFARSGKQFKLEGGVKYVIKGGNANIALAVGTGSSDDGSAGSYTVIARSRGEAVEFIAPNKWLTVSVQVTAGSVTIPEDTVIYPILYKAEDYYLSPTYEPYHESVELSKYNRSEANILGAKNLIPYPFADAPLTQNGITYVYNSDNSITANGTATSISWRTVMNNFSSLKLNERYILSGCPNGGSDNTYSVWVTYNDGTEHTYKDYGNGVEFVNGGNLVRIQVVIANGYTANNLVFKPMLRLASDPDDTYAPYAMTNRELTKIVNKNVITDTSNNTTFSIPLVRKSDGYTYGVIIGSIFMYHFFINTPSASNAVTFNKIYDGAEGRTFTGSYANGVFTITSSATIYGGIMVITSNV